MIMYGTKKTKLVKDVEIKIELPEEKPQIGKASSFGVKLQSKEKYYLDFVLFELINERTDKRAPLDRVTSRSRYLYRYNVEEDMEPETESAQSFSVRIPVHKEPSRNDKFICIRWELRSQVYLRTSADDKELLCTEGTPTEVEVV